MIGRFWYSRYVLTHLFSAQIHQSLYLVQAISHSLGLIKAEQMDLGTPLQNNEIVVPK